MHLLGFSLFWEDVDFHNGKKEEMGGEMGFGGQPVKDRPALPSCTRSAEGSD